MTPADDRRALLRKAHAQAQKRRRAGVDVPERLKPLEREYWADYERRNPGRADPEVSRWTKRTIYAAHAELARRHPGEYAAILWEIREGDPRPEAGDDGQRGEEAADAA